MALDPSINNNRYFLYYTYATTWKCNHGTRATFKKFPVKLTPRETPKEEPTPEPDDSKNKARLRRARTRPKSLPQPDPSPTWLWENEYKLWAFDRLSKSDVRIWREMVDGPDRGPTLKKSQTQEVTYTLPAKHVTLPYARAKEEGEEEVHTSTHRLSSGSARYNAALVIQRAIRRWLNSTRHQSRHQ